MFDDNHAIFICSKLYWSMYIALERARKERSGMTFEKINQFWVLMQSLAGRPSPRHGKIRNQWIAQLDFSFCACWIKVMIMVTTNVWAMNLNCCAVSFFCYVTTINGANITFRPSLSLHNLKYFMFVCFCDSLITCIYQLTVFMKRKTTFLTL